MRAPFDASDPDLQILSGSVLGGPELDLVTAKLAPDGRRASISVYAGSALFTQLKKYEMPLSRKNEKVIFALNGASGIANDLLFKPVRDGVMNVPSSLAAVGIAKNIQPLVKTQLFNFNHHCKNSGSKYSTEEIKIPYRITEESSLVVAYHQGLPGLSFIQKNKRSAVQTERHHIDMAGALGTYAIPEHVLPLNKNMGG